MTDHIAHLTDLEALERCAIHGRASLYPEHIKILVGMATCGRAAGAAEVLEAVREEVEGKHLPYAVAETGCIGWCSQEPLLDVWVPGQPRVTYGRVKPSQVREIIAALPEPKTNLALAVMTSDENPVTGRRTSYCNGGDGHVDGVPSYAELPLFKRQLRIVMRNCGIVDPASLEEYAARGGYRALWRALYSLTPQEVLQEVLTSGLRGRGGAGFPTGRKWKAVKEAAGSPKYIICNADEGDPGAYMDRGVLEGDPHSVIEGMIIGGYTMGAHEGVIYVREEYPLAVARLSEAILQAQRADLLGKDILGSGFSFNISITKGAGAFVCGEETALIASIEGRVGEPRPRPPYPAEKGLWGKPTCINNVETWATVPVIVQRGGAWLSAIGVGKSKGTKVFSLVGNVTNTALIEVPMGTTLVRRRERDRRRRPGGADLQGRADGRALGRVHPGREAGPAGGLREPHAGRLDHGIGRHDRDGRPHLHGGHREVLPRLPRGRVVRQVLQLPGGHAAHEGDRGPHLQGEGQGRGPPAARGPGLDGGGDVHVRARAERAQSRADDPALLPRRVPGPHPRAHAARRRCARS